MANPPILKKSRSINWLSWQLTVDQSAHGSQIEVNVTVLVTDVNDNRPIFDNDSYLAVVREDMPLSSADITNLR